MSQVDVLGKVNAQHVMVSIVEAARSDDATVVLEAARVVALAGFGCSDVPCVGALMCDAPDNVHESCTALVMIDSVARFKACLRFQVRCDPSPGVFHTFRCPEEHSLDKKLSAAVHGRTVLMSLRHPTQGRRRPRSILHQSLDYTRTPRTFSPFPSEPFVCFKM